jgi:mono/diheme cytochrome c family protein
MPMRFLSRRSRWRRAAFLAAATFFALGLISGNADEAAKRSADDIVFRDQVKPLLTGKCLACHGSDKKKGGLDLTRRATALAGGKHGAAIQPGKADDSLLLNRLAKGEMPPGNPLSPEQVAAFRKWIDAGAKYDKEPLLPTGRAGPDWWSLQKIAKPNLPRVKNEHWTRTPIDRFILAKLEDKALEPAPEADRAVLIRRVTFDLLGLPPTPEEIDAFAHDPAVDAYEQLVNRLLASPHYGERWGRHWLDVVRFAESHGYETNTLRFNAWPYRDYVIRAFNADLPYPQFVLEQLAGDTLTTADPLTQAATGFLVGGAHDTVGNETPDGKLQQRMDDLDDILTATAHTFLGMTVNCARCHDHKFDPIGQSDYYSLQAVFAGVQHAERELAPPDGAKHEKEIEEARTELVQLERKLDAFEPEFRAGNDKRRPPVNPRRNVERFAPVDARFVRFTVTATNDKIEPCIDELEIYAADDPDHNVALASTGAKATASSVFPNVAIHQIHHVNDGKYGNSWSWISKEPGKGWVQIELPRVMKIDRIVWGRDREERFVDRLPVAYRIEVEAEPGQWHEVASSEDRQPFQPNAKPGMPSGLNFDQQRDYGALGQRRDQLLQRLAILTKPQVVYSGTFAQPDPTYVLKRGDPMQKGEEVAPSALSAVKVPLTLDRNAPEKERRLALARWITHPDNPLAARVMVNRIWHYHFGRGIVDTPSDFGFNGSRPTHPELLDWLATAYRENGWQLKPLHRLIVLSATYRQSGQAHAQALATDQQNTLLWRRTPRRLEAEEVRDAILAVSGQLDCRMGGPGYQIWEKNTNYVTVFKPKAELGRDEFRRMVYQFKPRSQQDPVFGTFDCPDAALARPKRTVSTTVLQALNLYNSRFTLAQADYFAERLKREGGDDHSNQVTRAFQLAFGRSPNVNELDAAIALVRDHGAAALCRALFNANEFLFVD